MASTGATEAPGAKKAPFPARCYIQVFESGRLPPDYQLVAAEMKKRNIPVTTRQTSEILTTPLPLTPNDLVVGNFDWTCIALKQLGIPVPDPPDYPEFLSDLLNRKVWKTSLGGAKQFIEEHKGEQLFVKPSGRAKLFAAVVEPKDQMLSTLISGIPGVMPGHGKSLPVYCSTIIKMVCEYRVYVVDHEIRAVCQYRGPKSGKADHSDIDIKVVKQSVQKIKAHMPHLTGYGIDFATVPGDKGIHSTVLIEVNDGYSLGVYEGISQKDYADLLTARWESLMKLKK